MQGCLPKVMAVHDLSGFGRCSLTVALPVLSAAGITCVCLPTAVLSTHTGGFVGYSFTDLTEEMRAIADHWHRENISFQGIYTGYLANCHQLEIVKDIIARFRKENTMVVIDPVLGDENKLYSRFDDQMVSGMRSLCAHADVIVPNMTEAALLTHSPFYRKHQTEEEIHQLLEKLYQLGTKNVIITGVSLQRGHLGAACYDGKTFHITMSQKVRVRYDGTGDVFSSCVTACLVRGMSLLSAMEVAVHFTHDSIALTHQNGGNEHHGVDFEAILHTLRQRMEERL